MNRVIVLTPPGRAALATIRLEGPAVQSALEEQLVRRTGSEFRFEITSRPALVRFRIGDDLYEELILRVVDGQTAELHCHGNPLLVETIVAKFERLGFHRETWERWIQRTEKDALVAAARVALADAATWTVTSILLDQYGGAFSRVIDRVENALIHDNWQEATDILYRLLSWEKVGLHLTRPYKVVLVGPPNAGKSSILNWLVGYQRAIVDPTPGTTRDFVTVATVVEGWPVELYDTAGVRSPQDELEAEAIARTRRIASEADLVLLVLDRSTEWTADYGRLQKEWQDAMVILNKRDLPPGPGTWCDGWLLSTRIAEDRPMLLKAIAQKLVPEPPPPGEAIPFTPEQVARLKEALAATETRERTMAIRALRSLKVRESPVEIA
ncbi:MAG: tRNA modification GTPase MnmE [Thermogutta sp.]|nr:MAG: tRNA modification GTPase MnmE [Thermogutta sp.]